MSEPSGFVHELMGVGVDEANVFHLGVVQGYELQLTPHVGILACLVANDRGTDQVNRREHHKNE